MLCTVDPSSREPEAIVKLLLTSAGVTNSSIREALVALLATADPRTGAGSLNWARYSNPTVDGLVQHAMNQPRNDARELLLHEATRMAMRELALIPLYFVNEAWASRASLDLAPRSILVPLAERVSVAGAGGAGGDATHRSVATASPRR